jgi:hypothetical protein
MIRKLVIMPASKLPELWLAAIDEKRRYGFYVVDGARMVDGPHRSRDDASGAARRYLTRLVETQTPGYDATSFS